jgi:hypothetical protein
MSTEYQNPDQTANFPPEMEALLEAFRKRSGAMHLKSRLLKSVVPELKAAAPEASGLTWKYIHQTLQNKAGYKGSYEQFYRVAGKLVLSEAPLRTEQMPTSLRRTTVVVSEQKEVSSESDATSEGVISSQPQEGIEMSSAVPQAHEERVARWGKVEQEAAEIQSGQEPKPLFVSRKTKDELSATKDKEQNR